ncbi:CPBP family intramembrane glutamic endopeptidase [Clostridium estertheticum]|uniref:CPBP family intramembrane glutamic endopeptidase n=1 Tax=Clostridium estertheticum TaxID=238834 RepID=UPI001CF22058|nr:type II CAAX endopeptidase family protein [Clostridium estertheticum]MCB2354890.1 CPBP family intramembrane metalloprotease [Clostridium estertheticum]WAG41130.1 CPBP family intramembrane metalloprotease [Clostridium estertheticum]
MKFLENIEDGTINIKKMGIIKALFVMFLSILLEVFGQVPVEITNLFSGRFEKTLPYVIFVFGVLVKYYVIIVLLKWLSNRANQEKHKPHLNWKNFAYATLMIISFRLIFDNSLIFWVSGISTPSFINEAVDELAVSPIILIISVIIVAPIYEEIIFRGILLKGMSKKTNSAVAIVVSALLFAVVHMNIPQGINAFLLGLVLGFIYLNKKSIYLSIFAHFINNVLALSLSSFFSSIGGEYAIEIHCILSFVGIILLIIAFDGYKQNKINNKPSIYKQFIEV